MPTVAPTFVQEVYRTATGGSGVTQVLTLTVGTTAGNTLVISSKVGSSIVVTGVTDSKGNTWRQDYVASAGNARLSVFSAYLDTALVTGDTITVTLATTMNNCGHRVVELAGVPKTNYLDTGVATFATTAVSASSLTDGPTPGTLEANELFFTAWVGTITASQTVTPSAGWANNTSATVTQTVNSATQTAGAGGSTASVTWSESASQGNQSAVILAYRPIPVAAPVVPTVTGISPTSGSTAGGTLVTLAGTNFTGATAVVFGAVTTSAFTFIDSNTITVNAPVHTPTTVHIKVTTPAGTSSPTSADQFTYIAPPPSTYVHYTVAGGTLGVPADGGTPAFPQGAGQVIFSSDGGGVVFPDDGGRNL